MKNDAVIQVFETSSGTTLTLVGWVKDYESLIFKRSSPGVGDFTIKIAYSLENASVFTVDRLIYVRTEQNPHDSRVGIITGFSVDESSDGAVLTVNGLEAKGMTYWRIVKPDTAGGSYDLTAVGETVIKTVISKYLGPSGTSDVQIPFLTIETDEARGDSYAYSESYSELEGTIEDVADSTFLWWYFGIDLDNKGLILKVYEGQTLSLPFSKKFKTLLDNTVTNNTQDYRNYCIVEGDSSTFVYVGDDTGFARRETYVSATDLSSTTDLNTKGDSTIASKSVVWSMDATIAVTDRSLIDVDYSIGDYVNVESNGLTASMQVTEVTESWDSSGYSVDHTFGDPVSTTLDRIKGVSKLATKALTI